MDMRIGVIAWSKAHVVFYQWWLSPRTAEFAPAIGLPVGPGQ